MGLYKHGHSGRKTATGTYRTWMGMMTRCYNENRDDYKHYGGRGIVVCDAWHEFPNFLADMGERPDDRTLDRIDNDKNYCKENCRWATIQEQRRNTRANRLLTLNGETRCLTEWAKRTGLPAGCITHRLEHGWSDERALTTPHSRKDEPAIKLRAEDVRFIRESGLATKELAAQFQVSRSNINLVRSGKTWRWVV